MKIIKTPKIVIMSNTETYYKGVCSHCEAEFEATDNDRGVHSTYSGGHYCNCPFCGNPVAIYTYA